MMCHSDRSAAKWRDLLFVWVSNGMRRNGADIKFSTQEETDGSYEFTDR
jgi:hypothetical protein